MAVLGAIEAGKVADAQTYIEKCQVKNVSSCIESTFALKKNTLASSLEGTMVFGYLHHSNSCAVETSFQF